MRFLRHIQAVFLLFLFMIAIPVAQSPAAVQNAGYGSKIDPISEECMVCHDGSVGYHTKPCFVPNLVKPCGSHIVSADYAALAARKKGLNPEGRLPPEIVLFNGILTCVTCHGDDPHLGDPLAMDNRGSRLCRACHQR